MAITRSGLGIGLILALGAGRPFLARRLSAPMIAVGTVVAVGTLWALLYFAPGRVSEIYVEGTSGYYRYNFPIRVVLQSLEDFWIGIPFGSVSDYVWLFSVYNGGFIGTSLDNGVAIFLVYFGWPLLILLVSVSLFGILGTIKLNMAQLKLIGFLFLMLQFTGGVFLFTFATLACLLIFSARLSQLPDRPLR
jgi:hypothetical protein